MITIGLVLETFGEPQGGSLLVTLNPLPATAPVVNVLLAGTTALPSASVKPATFAV